MHDSREYRLRWHRAKAVLLWRATGGLGLARVRVRLYI